jgi:hypothetical protein
MVSGFYGDRTGGQPYEPPSWPKEAPATLPWTPEAYKLLQDIMERMKKLDEKLGLPDCEDPKKAEWMKSVEQRIKKLEKRQRKVKA